MYRPMDTAALDFSGRSPYGERNKMYGVPPAEFIPLDVKMVNGVPTVGGAPLQSSGRTPAQLVTNPSQTSGEPPRPTFDSSLYGDSGMFTVTLVAGTPMLVLARPNQTRVQLTIQNQNAVGAVFYNFDKAADASNIAIAAGGNRLWDSAVPQGNLWLMAPAGAVCAIEFINKDITKG